MTSSLLLWTTVALCSLCAAVPTISFPINSQVPPAARVGQPFSFVFSPSTFSSTEQLTYHLADAPDWLSIDSAARRLHGTPKKEDFPSGGDIFGLQFGVVAVDGSGSASMSTTLVVSQSPSPSISLPLSKQVPEFGSFSQPSSIIASPDTEFAFSFASDTFSDPAGNGLTYYAVTEDNTPLPSWISFDPARLSFSGRTPSLDPTIQTPQSLSLQLIAGDIVGFSASSLHFSIVFGNHRITADNSFIVLDAVSESRLSYTKLESHIKFDGQPAKPGDVSVASTPGIPSWLSVDKETWEISGTPPTAAKSSNFTITLEDSFSDTLNMTVALNVTNGLFKGSLPKLTITAGEPFKVDLSQHLSNPSDTELSVDVTPRSAWIKFDSGRRTISGDAPETLSVSSIAIEVHAKSKSSGLELSQDLPVRIRATNLRTTSSETSSRSTPTSSPSSSADPTSDGHGRANMKQILMATLIPTLLLLLVLVCIVLCYVRRRRRRGQSTTTVKRTLSDAKDKAKDSFQSLIHHSLSHSSRGSHQKSYAQAAIGSLRKFKPDTGAFPGRSPRLPLPGSPTASTDAPGSEKQSWMALMAGKISGRRPDEGYLPRTSLHDEKQKGVLVGASHHEISLPRPHNNSANPFGDTFETDMPAPPTPDMTSVQSAPNFVYSGIDKFESSSEVDGHHRATTFGEFTTGASTSSGTSDSQPGHQPPAPTAKTLTTRPWAAGNVTRFMASFGKQKGPAGKIPEQGLPVNVPVPSTTLSPHRPATWRGQDPGSCGAELEKSEIREASPPNRACSTSALPGAKALGLSYKAAQKKSLGVPYEQHVPGPPPAFPSKTWSTLNSVSEDEQGTRERGGRRRSWDSMSKVNSLPLDMSYTSTTVSSQPNWTVLRESPTPGMWGAGGPQRPRRASDVADGLSESSSHYGTRPPSRRRDWMGAGGGSKHSRMPSSRFGGPGTHSVASSVGSGRAPGGFGRDRTLASTIESEDSYAVYI